MEVFFRNLKKTAAKLAVLYAEDHTPFYEKTVKLLSTYLEFGRLDRARDGHDALFQFGKHRYHLVITDFDMPGMTGSELIHRIQATNPRQQVVILTHHLALVNVRDLFYSSPTIHLIGKETVEEAIEGINPKNFWDPMGRAILYSTIQEFNPK